MYVLCIFTISAADNPLDKNTALIYIIISWKQSLGKYCQVEIINNPEIEIWAQDM